MNDRFKFRYADKNNKVYDVMHLNFFFGELEVDMYDHIDTYKLEPDNLLQCTGLKDKNGKLIYEGDILKNGSGHYQIKYNPKGYWQIGDYALAFLNPIKNEIEVVGNIYENPEMLERTEDD